MNAGPAGVGVPHDVEIRRADEADLPAIGAIYVDAARHHAALDPELYLVPDAADAAARIGARLRAEGHEVWVATVGGQVAGLLELDVQPEPSAGSMMRPRRALGIGVAVAEAWRGCGIGQSLMGHAEQRASALDCSTLVLDAAAANEPALRLYRRLGYDTFGVLMRKRLDDGRVGGARGDQE